MSGQASHIFSKFLSFLPLQQEIEELVNTKSQLQKNNKYLERKYMATVTERDEVNSNCNRLAGDISNLEQKLKNAEKEIASWTTRFQVC